MEPVSHQPSPFANLNILNFLTCPATVYMELQPHENVATSTEIKNNMQDSFLSAIITMISREVCIHTTIHVITMQCLFMQWGFIFFLVYVVKRLIKQNVKPDLNMQHCI